MFDMETVWESVKRRWVFALVAAIICGALGAVLQVDSEEEAGSPQSYTAEAVLYVDGYKESSHVGAYNYQVSDSLLITDSRYVIMSNDVAGDVRRELGEDVTISSPSWIDSESEKAYSTRFIFIHASAPDENLALNAATLAAEKARSALLDLPTVASVVVVGDSVICANVDAAMDFGSSILTVDSADEPALQKSLTGIAKYVLVFAMIGFLAVLVAFAGYDILSGRVRSPRDISRILEIPPLNLVGNGSIVSMANNVNTLMNLDGFSKLVILSATDSDCPDILLEELRRHSVPVVCASSCSRDGVMDDISLGDSILVASKHAASSRKDNDMLKGVLRFASKPIVGAVYIAK